MKTIIYVFFGVKFVCNPSRECENFHSGLIRSQVRYFIEGYKNRIPRLMKRGRPTLSIEQRHCSLTHSHVALLTSCHGLGVLKRATFKAGETPFQNGAEKIRDALLYIITRSRFANTKRTFSLLFDFAGNFTRGICNLVGRQKRHFYFFNLQSKRVRF